MAQEPRPMFLERASFRRRRLSDAAAIIPFFGIVLLCIPAIWASESRTATAMVYVFTVWAVLILVVGLIARRLKEPVQDDDPQNMSPDLRER